MSEDLSPSQCPFTSKIRDLVRAGDTAISVESALTLFEYVDLAKRALLEHRVREFTAADVVALATAMEARDRTFKIFAFDREA
jgi:hypothetical protein